MWLNRFSSIYSYSSTPSSGANRRLLEKSIRSSPISVSRFLHSRASDYSVYMPTAICGNELYTTEESLYAIFRTYVCSKFSNNTWRFCTKNSNIHNDCSVFSVCIQTHSLAILFSTCILSTSGLKWRNSFFASEMNIWSHRAIYLSELHLKTIYLSELHLKMNVHIPLCPSPVTFQYVVFDPTSFFCLLSL